jgi:octaprenyl-diphosphate synthase
VATWRRSNANSFAILESQVALIPTIGHYIQQGGGKRIRPAVLLMAARMSGYTGEHARSSPRSSSSSTRRHSSTTTSSTNPDMRRGRQAVPFALGETMSPCCLATSSTSSRCRWRSQRDSLDFIRLLCEVTLRMIEGELYQLTKNGVVDLSEDEHFEIIRRKTAYLFAGSARIGGMLGPGTNTEQEDALWDYGLNIGMAFQLVDDLLDFTGEEDALGKPVGGDLREGKMTLPVIHLLASNDARAALLIRKIVNERNASVDEWHELRNLLAQHRSIDYTRRVATDFVERAKDALQIFPASAERDALMYLPDYVLSRDR